MSTTFVTANNIIHSRFIILSWPRALSLIYLTFGIICSFIISYAMPPWENPDEGTHFMRAEQVSRGIPIGSRLSDKNAGGIVDGAIIHTIIPFFPLRTSRDAHPTRAMYAATENLRWGTGDALGGFPNTAVYPPTLYAPAALGIYVGKTMDWTVLRTLRLSRLINGIISVTVASIAIALAGSVAPILFVWLSLPMVFTQMAAVTQDGPLFAFAALAVALLCRPLCDAQPLSRMRFAGACLCIILFAMGRPPYVTAALMLLLPNGISWRIRATGFAVVITSVLSWIFFAQMTAVVVFRADIRPDEIIDPILHAKIILTQPWMFIALMSLTLWYFWGGLWEQAVGVLSWLDVPLPRWFYVIAILALVIGSALSSRSSVANRIGPSVACTVIITAIIGLFAVQFMVWTPIGANHVHGVQGRYFTPIFMFSSFMIPRISLISDYIAVYFISILAIFPFIGLYATWIAVAGRYGF
ncbi:MAG: DUF2142 domain-containing protein [Alphaproteobacteria bacterium]|jgi:uncharacterized membrane protein|nr:DUF2142 domain-containing protein [Alphaproteobacteria bacterium]